MQYIVLLKLKCLFFYFSCIWKTVREGVGERKKEREIHFPLVHSPNICKTWGDNRPNSRARNSICVSHLVDKDSSIWAITCYVTGCVVKKLKRSLVKTVYCFPWSAYCALEHKFLSLLEYNLILVDQSLPLSPYCYAQSLGRVLVTPRGLCDSSSFCSDSSSLF